MQKLDPGANEQNTRSEAKLLVYFGILAGVEIYFGLLAGVEIYFGLSAGGRNGVNWRIVSVEVKDDLPCPSFCLLHQGACHWMEKLAIGNISEQPSRNNANANYALN